MSIMVLGNDSIYKNFLNIFCLLANSAPYLFEDI